ncbi:MAG: acylphosphatase [Candidatus Margulisiibacteriota bacterium]
MLKRAEATFFGRVQGVGFRFTAENVANAYKLTGFVRNLPDGSVEVVVEGEEGEIKSFLATINEELDNYIEKYKLNWFPPTAEYKRFTIQSF